VRGIEGVALVKSSEYRTESVKASKKVTHVFGYIFLFS